MRLLNTLTLSILLLHSLAQEKFVTRLDLRTYMKLQNSSTGSREVSLLVKGDAEEIKNVVQKYRGLYKYGYGKISAIQIAEKDLMAFSNEVAVEKIEPLGYKGHLLMDTARIRNNIDSVHAGYTPLIKDYKGRGVVMGIIDGGIYWQHPDFIDSATGKTRIRYIWDQDVNGSNTPLPYQYGAQWSWLDINNGNCTHVPPANDFGHGTHVAGIAAGNSFSTKGTAYENKLTGVAPESEIVAVKVKIDDDQFLQHVADAVDYIFKKADALGKPCVINTSVGTYYGSHDGQDLATKLIEDLLDERNGRVLVAAAGNGGHIAHHLGYDVPADSAYTFFRFNTSSNNLYFDFWADTADAQNMLFTIGCNDTTGLNLGRLPYMQMSNFNPAPNSSVTQFFTLNGATGILGQVGVQVWLDEGRYHVEFLISPANNINFWRLQTSGSGRFDLWASSGLLGTSDMVSEIGGNPILFPGYKLPDTQKTIVSSWQCSDKVITVGNYSNQAGYLDRDGNYVNLVNGSYTFGNTTVVYDEVVGKRFKTSSFGPTRDNRQKPDVMATGSTIIATGDANFIAVATAPVNRQKVSVTLKHIRNGGTSMASPIVAGIAALYLEKRPTATYREVKDIVQWTAVSDSFTGTTPNYEYGHGKVDAFAALTYTGIIYGATDTACINYNPQANVDTGGCVAKVYGCTDTAAVNYNPLANIDNGSCQYSVSVKNTYGDEPQVIVMPNPFSSETAFNLSNLPAHIKAEIRIFTLTGALHDVMPLITGVGSYRYRKNNSPSGIYFYHIYADGLLLKTGKLVIE